MTHTQLLVLYLFEATMFVFSHCCIETPTEANGSTRGERGEEGVAQLELEEPKLIRRAVSAVKFLFRA